MTDELRADPINDDVIEMDEDTRKSSAFREAFPDDTEPRGWAEHYFEVGYEAGRRAERVSAVATEAVAWLTDIEPGCSGVGCDYCQKLAEFRAVIEVDNG